MDWQDVSENGNGDAMVRILGNDDPREVGKSGWIHGVAGRALAETPTPPQDAEMSEAVRRLALTVSHRASHCGAADGSAGGTGSFRACY